MTPSSPQVLIIRLDAIGDALALAPLLLEFKTQQIPVDVLLSERNRNVYAAHAMRNGLVNVTTEQLQALSYTHVLVATEDASGYRLARETRAPHRIGFSNGWGKPLKSLWLHSQLTQRLYRSAGLDPKTPHEAQVLFSLGRSIFGESATPARDPLRLRPLIIEDAIEADGRIAFQVTDKWERLGIQFDAVVALAQQCAEHYSMHWIASSHESAFGDRFAHRLGVPISRYQSLIPWKAAITNARGIIAPDSGAIHVAGMTGVPTIAIFAAQRDLSAQVARWKPWAAPHVIIEASDRWEFEAFAAAKQLFS